MSFDPPPLKRRRTSLQTLQSHQSPPAPPARRLSSNGTHASPGQLPGDYVQKGKAPLLSGFDGSHDSVAQNELSNAVDMSDPEEEDDDAGHCAICLSPIENKAVIVPCLHGQFCFGCIRPWTDQSRKCPLCLGPIQELYYNIRSEKDFQTLHLHPLVALHPSPSDFLLPLPRSAFPGSSSNVSTLPRHALYGRPRRQRMEDTATWRETLAERALERRRYVYREGLYAKHIASNRYTRFKPVGPSNFASNPDLKSRVVSFVRRELQVFPNVDVSFLTTYLLSIASQLDLRSASAIRLISDFLSEEDAEHLVHEISTFARSPFTSLEAFDRCVQYGRPTRIVEADRDLLKQPIPSRTILVPRPLEPVALPTDGARRHSGPPRPQPFVRKSDSGSANRQGKYLDRGAHLERRRSLTPPSRRHNGATRRHSRSRSQSRSPSRSRSYSGTRLINPHSHQDSLTRQPLRSPPRPRSVTDRPVSPEPTSKRPVSPRPITPVPPPVRHKHPGDFLARRSLSPTPSRGVSRLNSPLPPVREPEPELKPEPKPEPEPKLATKPDPEPEPAPAPEPKPTLPTTAISIFGAARRKLGASARESATPVAKDVVHDLGATPAEKRTEEESVSARRFKLQARLIAEYRTAADGRASLSTPVPTTGVTTDLRERLHMRLMEEKAASLVTPNGSEEVKRETRRPVVYSEDTRALLLARLEEEKRASVIDPYAYDDDGAATESVDDPGKELRLREALAARRLQAWPAASGPPLGGDKQMLEKAAELKEKLLRLKLEHVKAR